MSASDPRLRSWPALWLALLCILPSAGCDWVFGLHGREEVTVNPFAGCFTGRVETGVPGQPNLTIVVQPPSDPRALTLTGCSVVSTPQPIYSSFVGMSREDTPTVADITTTQVGSGAQLDLIVEREPAGEAPANTISLLNAAASFRAPNLARCAAETTCAALGVPTP